MTVDNRSDAKAIEDLVPEVADIVPYPYSQIKNDEYDAIIDSFLEMGVSQGGAFPVLFHMGGIPGSGKTTYYLNNRDSFRDYVFVGFDNVMDRISAYREDNRKLGSAESFKRWMFEARVIGYELLLRAIRGKFNIFLDHSGLCDPHVSLMRNLKNCGYRTKMYFIRCDVDLAQARILEREKVTGRHTPRELLEDRFNLVERCLGLYREVVDELTIARS